MPLALLPLMIAMSQDGVALDARNCHPVFAPTSRPCCSAAEGELDHVHSRYVRPSSVTCHIRSRQHAPAVDGPQVLLSQRQLSPLRLLRRCGPWCLAMPTVLARSADYQRAFASPWRRPAPDGGALACPRAATPCAPASTGERQPTNDRTDSRQLAWMTVAICKGPHYGTVVASRNGKVIDMLPDATASS